MVRRKWTYAYYRLMAKTRSRGSSDFSSILNSMPNPQVVGSSPTVSAKIASEKSASQIKTRIHAKVNEPHRYGTPEILSIYLCYRNRLTNIVRKLL